MIPIDAPNTNSAFFILQENVYTLMRMFTLSPYNLQTRSESIHIYRPGFADIFYLKDSGFIDKSGIRFSKKP